MSASFPIEQSNSSCRLPFTDWWISSASFSINRPIKWHPAPYIKCFQLHCGLGFLSSAHGVERNLLNWGRMMELFWYSFWYMIFHCNIFSLEFVYRNDHFSFWASLRLDGIWSEKPFCKLLLAVFISSRVLFHSDQGNGTAWFDLIEFCIIKHCYGFVEVMVTYFRDNVIYFEGTDVVPHSLKWHAQFTF